MKVGAGRRTESLMRVQGKLIMLSPRVPQYQAPGSDDAGCHGRHKCGESPPH